MKALKSVILTLQYCLETFEQTCQCGRCDPCRRGQDDIKQAIRTIENLLQPG
jgi:NADH:ubiquinone oxidoreductase subunit F (NADH-binding)